MIREVSRAIVRVVADDPELEIALQDLRRDLARLAAADLHLDARIAPPVAADERQQVERRRFVGADEQPAGGLVAQLGQGLAQLGAQVVETAGVIEHDLTGVGQAQLPAAAIDERLAQRVLQALHGQRDGGLGARQLDRRPREALLGGDGAKNGEGGQIHDQASWAVY